jgi:hypothetical protein
MPSVTGPARPALTPAKVQTKSAKVHPPGTVADLWIRRRHANRLPSYFFSPFFFRSLLASLLPKSPIRSTSLLTSYFAVPVPPIALVYSVYLCLLSYPRIHVASHPRSLLAATASLHQSCKSVTLAPLPYDLTPLPRFNYSTRSSLSYTDQPHLSSRP